MNLEARYSEIKQRLDGLRLHDLEADEIESIVMREVQAHADQQLRMTPNGDSSLEDNDSQETASQSLGSDSIQRLIHGARSIAKLDRSIESKLHEVKCPANLADRLKQATRNQQIDGSNEVVSKEASNANDPWAAVLNGNETAASSDDAVMPADLIRAQAQLDELDTARQGRRGLLARIVRRKSFAYGLIVLLAVGMMTSIGIAVMVLNQPPELISRERLSHETISWKRLVDEKTWNQAPSKRLDSYPVNSDLLLLPHHWMEIRTKYDPSTVVYDATPPGQKQVIQFTIRSNRSFNLERLMPTKPIYETSAYCIGACYDNGFVYVLFVEGDENRYHQVLRRRLPAG